MALCSLSIASKEEEELLKQAIALSLEGAEDNDQDNSEQDAEEDGEDEEEERMLRQAIVLSLEGAEDSDQEESSWILIRPKYSCSVRFSQEIPHQSNWCGFWEENVDWKRSSYLKLC